MRSVVVLFAALFFFGCAAPAPAEVILKPKNECVDREPMPRMRVTSGENRRPENQPVLWDWSHPRFPIDWSQWIAQPERELLPYCTGKIARTL